MPDALHLEAYYRRVSPQLLARVRQLWSARGLDLDLAWRATTLDLPGVSTWSPSPEAQDSRPVDLLLLFDQATIWLHALRIGTGCAQRMAMRCGRAALSADQQASLLAILARLREETAAVRVLAGAGLATPAMQIIRSLSEDVDMALVMLLRPKVARQFALCRSPQESGDFWKRHIAGGRAFRAVAEQLYLVGLDYSEDSSYATWRKEVQVLLGAAVHTSFLGSTVAGGAGAPGGAILQGGERAGTASSDSATEECLYFATLRLQEMCIYTAMLGQALRQDLVAGAVDAGPDERLMIRVATEAAPVILDQMRWLTAAEAGPNAG